DEVAAEEARRARDGDDARSARADGGEVRRAGHARGREVSRAVGRRQRHRLRRLEAGGGRARSLQLAPAGGRGESRGDALHVKLAGAMTISSIPAPLRLGPYELLRRIATGGMAEVYLARRAGPHGFQKIVAVKRILPQYARDPDFVAMFVDEARVC